MSIFRNLCGYDLWSRICNKILPQGLSDSHPKYALLIHILNIFSGISFIFLPEG